MRSRVCCGAVSFLLAFAALSYGTDWPTWRGDNARRGISSETLALPLVKKWEFKTGGALRGSPIVVQGVVVFGSCDHTVYCLDLATGKERWRFVTGAPVESTAAAAEGLVCIGSDDGKVYALNLADGKLVWSFRAPGETHWIGYNDGYFISTQAVRGGILIQDGVAYFACGVMTFEGGAVCAVNIKDGKSVWQNTEYLKALNSQDVTVGGAPTAVDGKLYLASGGLLASFELSTGKFLWSRSMEGNTASIEVVQGADGLWVHGNGGSWFYWVDFNPELWANPSPKWADDKKRVRCTGGLSTTVPPIDTGTRLYVYQMKKNCILALNRETFFKDWSGLEYKDERPKKATLWQSEPLGKGVESPVRGSPVLAGELLFVGGGNGRFVALGTADGKELWGEQLDGVITTSPAVSQERVLVGTDAGTLYCFAGAR